jgi:hypothetical protein
MKSTTTRQFWKLYRNLPLDVQWRARKAYQIWRTNPYYPALHFKRVDDQEPIYSARVSDGYRVLGELQGDTIVWFWIGKHEEYERMLK